ncbi:MAG: LacI family DNA-binding transcriptional regulator [Anaerocolumna sp.]
MKKITIQEVAKELNLSRNTVAKALNNSNTVAYETKYMVIKKAYELGYQKLSQRVLEEYKVKSHIEKAKTVVVFARRELSTFWNRIIMGISEELNKNNCKLQLNFISDEEEENLVSPLDMESDMSGIIILNVFSKAFLELIIKKEVPIVFLDGPSDIYEIAGLGDVILFEGFYSMKMLTKHLIEQGIKEIGFIGDISYCKTIRDRYDGFMEAMCEHHIEPKEQFLITNSVAHKYYRQEEVSTELAGLEQLPKAFVCANDEIAKDVMLWLKKRGIKVPKEIAVTGFDDKEEVGLLSPSLTTVHIGNQRMGKRLAQRLIWRLENKDLPKEIVIINTEVMIRESSVL